MNRRKLMRIVVFVSIVILLTNCGDERSNFFGFDTRLTIKNNSTKDVFYGMSYAYPKLTLESDLYWIRL